MSTAARVRTDPRISRRRRAIERSRRRRVLTSAATVAALGGALWLAFLSPLLAVDDVVVLGSKHVSSEEVAVAAGLDPRDNLLLVSTAEVTAAVEELPWVRHARVDRSLPGTVRVKIVERRPGVVLSTEAGRWTIDMRGNVLTRGVAGKALPVLAATAVSEPQAGEKLIQPEVRDALAALRALAPRIRRTVEAVLAPSSERITLSLRDGTQIRFGAAESLRAKNEVLEALLPRLRAEGGAGAYVDIRVPTSPAVSRPAASSTTQAPAEVAPTPSP